MARSIGGIAPPILGIGGNMLQTIAIALSIISGSIILIILSRLSWLKFRRFRNLSPSLDLEWVEDCKGLCQAKFDGSIVELTDLRDFTWTSKRDHDGKWITTKVNVDKIVDVWYIVDHFHDIKGLAHTMLSFEFEDGQFISFSFETRRELGERYHPWDGLWRAYELYLVVSTESDALALRTNQRKHKVHLFRATPQPGNDKALFLALCNRANELATNPEWYHTLTSSCTTAIVDQINLIAPGRIPPMWRTLLPGHSGRAAHRLKLIQDWGGYDETLRISRIDEQAQTWDGKSDYSTHIRANLPAK